MVSMVPSSPLFPASWKSGIEANFEQNIFGENTSQVMLCIMSDRSTIGEIKFNQLVKTVSSGVFKFKHEPLNTCNGAQHAHHQRKCKSKLQWGANQTYSEVSSHSSYNAHHQKIYKHWRGCGEKGTLLHS